MKKSLHIFTLFIFTLTLISFSSQARAIEPYQLAQGYVAPFYVDSENVYVVVDFCEEEREEYLACLEEAEEDSPWGPDRTECLSELDYQCRRPWERTKGDRITSAALMGLSGTGSVSTPGMSAPDTSADSDRPKF